MKPTIKRFPDAATLKTITISVTKGDITKGTAGDCSRCPVARALSRRILRGYSTHVSLVGVRFVAHGDARNAFSSSLPRVAYVFIGAFDRRKGAARPFKFSIELPLAFKFNIELPLALLR